MAGIAAQGVRWAIAPQDAAVGDAAFDHTDYSWIPYRVPSLTGGPMQNQATLPLETGGPLTPNGGYKAGAWYEQEVDIIPRLEADLGYLLYAATGDVTSISGQKYTNSGWATLTGGVGHLFRFNRTDHTDIPLLAVRYLIPGAPGADKNHGEYGYDGRATGLRLTIPGAGLITGRFGYLGRVPQSAGDTETDAWVDAHAAEGSTSQAHAGKGSINIGSTVPHLTGLTIDLLNNLDRAFIVGSFFLDEPGVLTRAVRMRASMRWQDPDVWNAVYYGGAEGAWTNLPYFSQTAGSVRGFFFEAQSADNMPSTSVPYALRVMADNVMISCDPNSLRIQAGGVIEYVINIDVLQPEGAAADVDYLQIALDNKVAAGTYEGAWA